MILLIHPGLNPFVSADYEILSKHTKVQLYHFRPSNKFIKMIIEQIRLVITLVRNIGHYKLIYIWFADYHSVLPVLFARLFRKKSFISVGGYDAVSIPQINFGVFLKKPRALCAKLSYKYTNLIIPVDESLIESKNYYIDRNGLPIGIRHFVKDLNTPIQCLPTGYSARKWQKNPSIQKENIFLSIGNATDLKVFRRKGFDLLLEAAKQLPSYQFIIIGLNDTMYNYAIEEAPDNVILHQYVPQQELIDYYSKAKVFCQLSISEGLPNTLCEAMLCECIPVGSSANGIPKAVGNAGYICQDNSVETTLINLKQAIEADASIGLKARERIISLFPLENRKQGLLKIVNKLTIDHIQNDG